MSSPPSRRAPWIAIPWVAAAPLLLACGGEAPSGPEPTASTSQAIYGGVLDNDGSANTAVVALEIGTGTTFTLCSGSLISPNVVLTARHCISALTATAASQISCDDNGNSTNGADFAGDQTLSTIHVFAGPNIYQGEPPTAGVKSIYHPQGTTLCNGDIALVVLDTAITKVTPLKVRVSGPVKTGSSVRAVGFGQNDQSTPIGTRYRKDGVSVLAVGSVVSPSQTPLGSNEFEIGESTCDGDSGGPAIDETTGAVVGVVSRAQSDCTLAYGHVYSSLQGFAPLFQQAFADAGGFWTDENGTTSGPGAGGGASDAGSASGSGGGSSSSSSSSSGGGGHGAGGSGGYSGGVNLHSGQGSGCAVARAGSGDGPGEAGFAAFALALLGLSVSRRRVR